MRLAILISLVALLVGCANTLEDRQAAYQARLADCTQAYGFDESNTSADAGGLALGEVEWRECGYAAMEEVFLPTATKPEIYREAIEKDRALTDLLAAGEITRQERRNRAAWLRQALADQERKIEQDRQSALQAEVKHLWERDQQRRKLDSIREDINAIRRSLLTTE